MLGKATNQLLQKTEQAVLAKVDPKMQTAVQRIVTAGMKFMYDPSMRDTVNEQLNQPGDPAEVAGEGVAKLIGILFQQSKGTMPPQAAMPAAVVLLCEVLDFMEKAGKVQVSNEILAQATQALSSYMLQLFGISKEKVQEAMQQAQKQQGAGPAMQAPQGIVGAARQGV